jgi:hypothetical protein
VVAVLVLTELAVGTLLATWAADLVGDVDRGFLGTTATICLLVMGLDLGLIAILPDPSQLLHQAVDAGRYSSYTHWCALTVGLIAAYALFCAVGTDPARRVVGGAAVAVGVTTLGKATATFGSPLLGGFGGALTFVPAALFAGATLAGMLLGHWYLIAPNLSFRPLRLAVYLIFATAALQAAAIAVALLAANPDQRGAVLSGTYGVSFWLLVVAAGVGVTVAVNGLTLYYARLRANQPATAMLYILVITVLMGLVPGHLLYFLTRVPV